MMWISADDLRCSAVCATERRFRANWCTVSSPYTLSAPVLPITTITRRCPMITCNKVVIVLWATDSLFLKSQSSARLSDSLQSGSDVVWGLQILPSGVVTSVAWSLVLFRVSSYILTSRKPKQSFSNPNPEPVNFSLYWRPERITHSPLRAALLPLYSDSLFGTKLQNSTYCIFAVQRVRSDSMATSK